MRLPATTTQEPQLLSVPCREEFHLVLFKLMCFSFSSVHKVLLCIFCLFAERHLFIRVHPHLENFPNSYSGVFLR